MPVRIIDAHDFDFPGRGPILLRHRPAAFASTAFGIRRLERTILLYLVHPGALKRFKNGVCDLLRLDLYRLSFVMIDVAPVRFPVQWIEKREKIVRRDSAEFRNDFRAGDVQLAALRRLVGVLQRSRRTPDDLRLRLPAADQLQGRLQPLRVCLRRGAERMQPVVEVDDVVFSLVKIHRQQG